MIDFYVNDVKRNEYVERFSFSNGITGEPAIEFQPADFSGVFTAGDKIQIFNNTTKLLEGTLKDINSVYDAGIKGEMARIHVRNVKEKVFTYDFENVTNITNDEAMSLLCTAGTIGFAKDTTSIKGNRFAMQKSNQSISFFPMMQDIAGSDGWGVWCDHDTLHVKDLINDTANTYSLLNPINVQYKYNDYNIYGNICINGMVNRKRLVSDDNPYISILAYNSKAVVDSISILATNINNLFSIVSNNDNFILSEDDEGRWRFTWRGINSVSIAEAIAPDSFSINTDGLNYSLEKFQLVQYEGTDAFGDHAGRCDVTGIIGDETSSILIQLKLAGKTPGTFTAGKTPDNFLKIYTDPAATSPADNRFLYYENYNFVNTDQISILMDSLKKECTTKILRLTCEYEGDHIFQPYERVNIAVGKTDIDGNWVVTHFHTRRRANIQRTKLNLVRAGVSIIPELKIYNPPTMFKTLENRVNDIYWKAIYLGNGTAFDLRRFKKRPIDLRGFTPRRGDMLNIQKAARNQYFTRDVIDTYVKNADIVDDTTSTDFYIETVTVTNNGDGTYNLLVKFNKPYDPNSIDISNFVVV